MKMLALRKSYQKTIFVETVMLPFGMNSTDEERRKENTR